MGQQARRALAERKYGKTANHVQKATQEYESRKVAREEKRKQWEEKQNASVHVSWQLKKKDREEKDRIIREMMKSNNSAGKDVGAIAAVGMGKKIVFD